MLCYYGESLLNKLFMFNVRLKIDLDNVEKAFAKEYHGQQDTREPTHPLEVACMVADYIFETDTIITAILHDTIEDTSLTKENIAEAFSTKIAEQVSGLTRISGNKKIRSRQMIKTLRLQNKKDLLLISDRLHNIKTISIKPYDKRRRIVIETEQEFVPLARYLKLLNLGKYLSKYCILSAS
ncbi:HD domain protein [Orientia chuto str. Dubai]|uniref:HD domain protein n=1 Tax=Orientia chuto str. Dubai TaxID=1359168 RepID=A0A0F3MLL5_9RICK|nr:HD domain-containing protein [Candidatus Orientia mediorientalis]KJV55504.1 HD domain protein [Orientia chuto str. Dubai]